MEPLATYSEKRFDGARTFKLMPDSVIISGSTTFRADFQVRVPLHSLDPHPNFIRMRNPIFSGGIVMAAISFLVHTTLVRGFHMDWLEMPPCLTACVGMAGVLLSLATFRKVEFIQFPYESGSGSMDLARSGPESHLLDGFVADLIRQIEKTKENHQTQ